VQLHARGDWWISYHLGKAYRLRHPPDYAEALRFDSIAWALHPLGAKGLVNLSGLLIKRRDWDGVVTVSRQALALNPDLAEAHLHLGVGLGRKGAWQQARAAYRKALELNPDLVEAHYNLGELFRERGQLDQAVPALEQAIRLAPADADAHLGLGNAWQDQGKLDAALASYARALELDPGLAIAHSRRGEALLKKGRLDEAIAALEKAIRLDPANGKFHAELGYVWSLKGRPEGALAANSRAVELNPKVALYHYNLANARRDVSDWTAADAAYREALRLDLDYAEAHCNLGKVLQEQGRFAEALAEIEQGHRLGSRRSDWRYPSEKWLGESRHLAALESKLPAVLAGREKPTTVAEQLEYASLCQRKGLYAASARLYAAAFTAEPALAASLETGHRYQAACVAALAGSGQGFDAPKPDASERARWRKQALECLRADLALWADRRAGAPNKLQEWRREKALAGLREAEELARLPSSERADYLRFWADVQVLLVQCLASPKGNTGVKAAD
jgi:tetratricopeptide (TPR) repeat protein